MITDAVLLEAVRKRILDQIANQQQGNPIYNMIGTQDLPATRGVGDAISRLQAPAAGGGDVSPDDFDYMVDIMRQNLPEDETGKSPGWTKKVHRYRTPKGEKPPGKKRVRSA
jgi:hypothetical protein